MATDPHRTNGRGGDVLFTCLLVAVVVYVVVGAVYSFAWPKWAAEAVVNKCWELAWKAIDFLGGL